MRDIEKALNDMVIAAKAEDVAALVETDVAFHRALCRATGNAALADVADELGIELLRERAAIWDLPGRPQRSVDQHTRILTAIKAGDAAQARAAVVAHFESVIGDVESLVSTRNGPRFRDTDHR